MLDGSAKVLNATHHDDWVFCISTIYCEFENYREFFLNQKQLGKKIILDNGAFEMFFMQEVTDEKKEKFFDCLRIAIEELQPDIIVEPDIPGDPKLSQEWSKEFKEAYGYQNLNNWGRCIHGKDLNDAIENYQEAASEDYIQMILLPYDNEYNKWELFEALVKENIWNPEKLHHSLGFELKDLKYWNQLKDYFFSVDSSKFVYYAHEFCTTGLPKEDYGRPKDYFDHQYNGEEIDTFVNFLKEYQSEQY